MKLQDILPHITGNTQSWNDELGKLIKERNEIINLSFSNMYGLNSPYLEVKLTDRQLHKLMRKKNNITINGR